MNHEWPLKMVSHYNFNTFNQRRSAHKNRSLFFKYRTETLTYKSCFNAFWHFDAETNEFVHKL